MSKLVTAKEGESLCSIAMEHGFKNCDTLRAEAKNSDFLERPLRDGDSVTVPDIVTKTHPSATEKKHEFKRFGHPTPKIRFVHGSASAPYTDDPTLSHLDISNYRTNKGGINGTGSFPAGFGFHANGDADPDTFKVEVCDLKKPGSVDVLLTALKPSVAGGITSHSKFQGAEATRRKLEVSCDPVSGGNPHIFRSAYLRIVSDEEDQKTLPDQTLLVTDMADGKGGEADNLEILDQKVRASVQLKSCQAADPHKCVTVTELPVGSNKKRLKLCLHAFRQTPGDDSTIVGGISEEMLRLRTMKWFRRAYAQANLAPKLVGPEVDFVDPPAPNMLVICQDHGRTASGVDGSANASTLSFKLGSPPGTGLVGTILSLLRTTTDPEVKVTLTAGMTPLQISQAIVTALPSGFGAQVAENARAFNAATASCDIIITATDGHRVVIYNESTSDTRLTIDVARVDINKVMSSDTSGAVIPTTIDFRRVLRSVTGADDRLDCFVVGGFDRAGLRGRAFVPATDLKAPFRPAASLRWAAIMGATSSSGAVMDGSDNLPFTFPHEAGHVLCDAFHTDNTDPNGPSELMSGTGTSQSNSVDATKRICGGAYKVRYAHFDPAQNNDGDALFEAVDAVDRFRTRGANVIEDW
ncbi:hypothetical protein [uncultured Paraglaciecola sp.]|uniref:hypothetical protein n=1 Tax=uncultured Paraglaciecola sp. TaxID=1765024 RepID=UPI0030DBC78F|tara:strand:- start:19193 stop:21109 length:1917 start_codon:yes stop_codon:yes gene_type:complete